MNARSSNIGSHLKTYEGLPPKANGVGSRNGTGIDRLLIGGESAVVIAHVGAATGTPTSFTYDLKVQHSDDNSAWADYTPSVPSGSLGAIAQQTAAGIVELDINLALAKQYVRVVETVGITGGTSPTIPASCEVVLGGSTAAPV